MKLPVFILFSLCVAFAVAGSVTEHEKERQAVKRLLSGEFAALNRGERTLSEVAGKAVDLAGETRSELRCKILLEGAVRMCERAGDENRAAEIRRRLESLLRPFEASGNTAVLRLGKYGEVEFARCPTGTVDVAVHWRNGKTVTVTLTKPYWIMKYPLTRMQSALFPPLDPPRGIVGDEEFSNYVCLNRSQAEGVCEHFTRYFKDVLPEGYVIRLPTLAEWEHAFHAGTRDPGSPFFDLLHIHMNDEVDRSVRYDYDRGNPRRKKAVNAWGIGDWCGQEKVCDMVDPAKITKSPKDGGDFHQVQGLPPFETTVDPCFMYDGTNRMSLIRMPFWARWNAARIGFNRDWCPIRLVIAPEIK